MPTPKIGQKVKVAFPPDVLADLRVIASMRGVPIHDVIRDAAAAYTKRMRRRGAA